MSARVLRGKTIAVLHECTRVLQPRDAPTDSDLYEHVDTPLSRHDAQTLDTATTQQAADTAQPDDDNMDVDDDDDDVMPHQDDDKQVRDK